MKKNLFSFWTGFFFLFFFFPPFPEDGALVQYFFIFFLHEWEKQIKKRGRWNRMEVNHNAIKGNRLVYFSLMCLLFEVLFQSLLFPLVTFILHLGWSHVKQRKEW